MAPAPITDAPSSRGNSGWATVQVSPSTASFQLSGLANPIIAKVNHAIVSQKPRRTNA